MLSSQMIPEWMELLGWALIYFLWQGALIGAIAWMALVLLRKSSANLRYLILCGAFVACGLAPCLTWLRLESKNLAPVKPVALVVHGTVQQPKIKHAATVVVPVAPSVTVATLAPKWTVEKATRLIHQVIPYFLILWIVGVIFLSARLLHGWLQLRKLCASGQSIKDQRWMERFHQLAERMGINRSILLLESVLIEVPTLIGWLRPVILVPATFFTGLSPDQIGAILAHELAHIRRLDYLVNLIQIGIETLLFYHPVIWWISCSIREERENCCDDLALQYVGDKLLYAKALASLEESRSLPMAITLAATGGSLLKRIKRLLGASEGRPFPWLLFLVLLMGVIAGAFALGQPDKTGKIEVIASPDRQSSISYSTDMKYQSKYVVYNNYTIGCSTAVDRDQLMLYISIIMPPLPAITYSELKVQLFDGSSKAVSIHPGNGALIEFGHGYRPEGTAIYSVDLKADQYPAFVELKWGTFIHRFELSKVGVVAAPVSVSSPSIPPEFVGDWRDPDGKGFLAIRADGLAMFGGEVGIGGFVTYKTTNTLLFDPRPAPKGLPTGSQNELPKLTLKYDPKTRVMTMLIPGETSLTYTRHSEKLPDIIAKISPYPLH